ncbi:hypothetical protein ACETK8_20085 (plasmid) [Brevundimonas staleyi]|uniref:Uncharacterized protein n=1 Tax=Brevundimonas staleyi TaxID=74326 RepID=A0ABW0FNI2_9CAUL
MSRHRLSSRSDLPRPVVVSCGWDAPLQTFFLQVEAAEPGPDEDPILLWMGADWREQPDPGQILEAAARWAEFPPGLAAILAREGDADRRDERPPLLAALSAMRRGS